MDKDSISHDSDSKACSLEYDPFKEAEEYIRQKKDKACLQVKVIDDVIGKGVFAGRDFCEGEFLLEYDGELIHSYKEGKRRLEDYPANIGSFIYLFNFKGKKKWIDGTFSKQKGRYVNDAPLKCDENNSEMKLLEVEGIPHLALFASRKIFKGEEIKYDYGDEQKNLPWRKKEPKTREERKKDVKVKTCSVLLEKLDIIPSQVHGRSKEPLTRSMDEEAMTALGTETEEQSGDLSAEATSSATTETEEPLTRSMDEEAMIALGTETEEQSGDLSAEATSSATTETEESLQVKKIWSQRDSTDFRLSCVYGINVTDRDIRSLQGTQWLTDQVIDAYLRMLCQAELDKGNPVMHIPTQAMTSICSGRFMINGRANKKSPFFPKHLLTSYEVLLGAYNQGRSHWILVVLEPSKGNFYFLDPFGHKEKQASEALHNWSAFLNERPMEERISWKVCCKDRTVQTDGFNCGVYCLMFAERYLTKQALTGIISSGLKKERRLIAEKIMMYEIYQKHACPCCGNEILSDEKISCISCGRDFHKKSYCVGEEHIKEDAVNILCRGCNQEMLVHEEESRHKKPVGEDAFDKFVCGKCDDLFTDIDTFLLHKQSNCSVNLKSAAEITSEKELVDIEVMESSQMNTSAVMPPEVSSSNCNKTASSESAPLEMPIKVDIEKKIRPKRPCPFCQKLQSSLTKHIQRCHKNEEEVKAAMRLPGPDKRRAFRGMKRQGIFNYNANLMKSKDMNQAELMKERNQSDKKIAMCSLCRVFINKEFMYRHARNCKDAEETTSPPSGLSLKVLQNTEYPQDFVQFIEKFHEDKPGQAIRNDPFLKEFGYIEYQNWKGSTIKASEKLTTLRSKLRRLARLFLQFKSMASDSGIEINTCDEMFRIETVKLLSAAVQRITNFDSELQELKSGLKLGLRSLVIEVCETLYVSYLIKREEQKAKEVKTFQEVLKGYWKYFFLTAQEALENKRQNQSRAPKRLPEINDMKKLREYTKTSIKEIVENVYEPMNRSTFCKLRNLISCRLTLFNARRGGEATRLTIVELEDALSNKWADRTFLRKVDEDVEKLMCKIVCAYLHSSKKMELVPVIIPEDCWKGLRLLVEIDNRKLAGVHPKNKFVFANTENSQDHVNGWQCVHSICKKAELGKNITATDMRHFVATYYESLEVSPEEREFFIRKHLGHSKYINENIYQCPPALKLLEMAGKVLLTLDSNEGKDNEEVKELPESEASEIASNKRVEGSEDTGTRKRRTRNSPEVQQCKKSRMEETKDVNVDDVEYASEDDISVSSEEEETAINEPHLEKKSKKQQRHHWTEEEDKAVREFFSKEIGDVSHTGNKGKLMIEGKIKEFMAQHPNILPNFSNSERRSKIRVKVVNCRRRTRELYFKRLEKLNT